MKGEDSYLMQKRESLQRRRAYSTGEKLEIEQMTPRLPLTENGTVVVDDD